MSPKLGKSSNKLSNVVFDCNEITSKSVPNILRQTFDSNIIRFSVFYFLRQLTTKSYAKLSIIIRLKDIQCLRRT